MPSDTPEELMRRLLLMSQHQPIRVYMQEKKTKWWKDAGVSNSHAIPDWCREGKGSQQRPREKTTQANIRYRLTYILLQEVRAFVSDGSHLACDEEKVFVRFPHILSLIRNVISNFSLKVFVLKAAS